VDNLKDVERITKLMLFLGAKRFKFQDLEVEFSSHALIPGEESDMVGRAVEWSENEND
jgi:hypothetical protein